MLTGFILPPWEEEFSLAVFCLESKHEVMILIEVLEESPMLDRSDLALRRKVVVLCGRIPSSSTKNVYA